jgi:hypothetical protein
MWVALLIAFTSRIPIVSAGEPSPEEKARRLANDLIKRASVAFDSGRFAEAARDYLRAEDLAENSGLGTKPELLFNAALALDHVGECDRSAELYDRYVDARPDAADDSDLARRMKDAGTCAPKLVLSTSPDGALVTIDGRPAGITPLQVHVKAGAHTLRITLREHQPLERALLVKRGEPLAIQDSLVSLVGHGKLALHIVGEGDVFIDGSAEGHGPYDVVLDLTAGQHRVRVAHAACASTEVNVDVPVSQEPVPLVVKPNCGPPALVFLDFPLDSQVQVDGQPMAGPWGERELPTGPHRLRIESARCGNSTLDVRIEPHDPPERVPGPPCPDDGYARAPGPLFWATGGAGAVALGGGVALMVAHSGAAAGAQPGLETAALISFVTAGAALGAAALIYLLR